jgi:hypothetical protein
LYFSGADNIHLKGLTVRNVRQYNNASYAIGIKTAASNNVTIENCIVHNIGGSGYSPSNDDYDTTYYINCDAFSCCDSLTTYDPGGGGFGFIYNTTDDTHSYISYYGCRAWRCSDMGIGGINDGYVLVDSCWSIHHGFYGGSLVGSNGTGFKMGWTVHPKDSVVLDVRHCISAYNRSVGYAPNTPADYPQRQMHIYNNFLYANGVDTLLASQVRFGFFFTWNLADTTGTWNCWYRNNLSYNNLEGDYQTDAPYMNDEYNYWNNPATVTDADFISLDSTGLCGARQADGSLPVLNFGKLAAGSNLIDAGTTNTGLAYVGSAPDIGWYEYYESGAYGTYYISPAPTGSDVSGSGSISKPWASLAHATDTVTFAGSIIHVNAGTYTETDQSALAVGVSIEGEGIETTSITSTIATEYGCVLLLSSGAEGTEGNQTISGIKIDGNNLTTYCAIWIFARSNIHIHDCEFVNFENSGVRFSGRVNGSGDGEPTTYATGNMFYDNIITNCAKGTSGGELGNLMIGGQSGMLIYGNTITANARTTGNNGVCIKATLGEGYLKGLKIYDNVLISDSTTQLDYYPFAIETWNSKGGLEVYDNTIHGVIDFGGDVNEKGTYDYSISCHDNYIGWHTLQSTNQEGGICIEAATSMSDVLIYKNLIKYVNVGIIHYPVDSSTYNNIKIYYNIFDQIGKDADGAADTWGFRSYVIGDGFKGFDADSLMFLNNLFIASTRAGGAQTAAIGLDREEDSARYTNLFIRNNIFVGWEYANVFIPTTTTIDYMYFQNNISYGNGFENLPRIIAGADTSNYVASDNLIDDPEFLTPTTFYIKTTSPAKNAGIDVGLTTDYAGRTIKGLPDIGAYEYIGNYYYGTSNTQYVNSSGKYYKKQ